MTSKGVISESSHLLGSAFELQPLDQKELTHKALLDQLTKVVQTYLNNDLNGLLNILYRIDLSESLVDEILTSGDPTRMAEKLSLAILNRTYQKAETRIRYRK